MLLRPWSMAVLALVAACGGGKGGGRAACGLAALAGPTALLTQFGVPNQTLSEPPRRLPERLVVRVVAGDAYPAVVGRTDSLLVVGVEGSLPAKARPGFGVLVVDQQELTRGVMLYEGDPVEGAPRLGNVSVGGATVPLIGIQLDPTKVEDANCPLFPDSLVR
ncbi:MAG TPA: hypothetical protein VM387_11695 [Gemmatimonadales bacterium]|nr:hypothetical protein [Gemmatimonadales bacterium]